jgi:hypothetical protein
LISLLKSDGLAYCLRDKEAIDSIFIYGVSASFFFLFSVKRFGIHAFFFRIIFIRPVFRDIVLYVIFALFISASLILELFLSACLVMIAVIWSIRLFCCLFFSCSGNLLAFCVFVRLKVKMVVEALGNRQGINYSIR